MRIIFDNIIFALQNHGGISVVWHELLKRFIDDKYEYLCINTCPQGNVMALNDCIPDRNREDVHSKRYLKATRYMPCRVRKDYRYIFHSTYYRYTNDRNAINITTVHDFTYELYNSGIRKWIHSWQKRKAILHSDYIICISENTKKDLMKFCPEIKEDRVRVIYNGVAEDYCLTDKGCDGIVPYGKQEYAVFVGSRAAYKNFELAVKAVAATNLNLVIVGAKLSDKEKSMVDGYLDRPERYFCTGFIDNGQLNIVYNNAYALLYPSEYEGFGIPVIEAQRAGCPVIAFNGSSIPEVTGDDTLLINNAETEQETVEKLKMLENEETRRKVVEKGLENCKRFSWDKAYRETVELYETAWNSINNK